MVCPGFRGVRIAGFWCLTSVGTDATRGYPAEVRRKVLDLLAERKSRASVAHDLDTSDQTIYGWRRHHRIDRRLQSDLRIAENAELAMAKKQITELQTEHKIRRHAIELLKGETSQRRYAAVEVIPRGQPPRTGTCALSCDRSPPQRACRWVLARHLPRGSAVTRRAQLVRAETVALNAPTFPLVSTARTLK